MTPRPSRPVFMGFALAAGLLLSACAQDASGSADPSAKAAEAEIHFASLGGIRDWRADGNRALYVQGRNRQWYHAELMGPCTGLNFAIGIGFVIEPTGSFDRFSAVLVDGRVCHLTSLVESGPPPAKPPTRP